MLVFHPQLQVNEFSAQAFSDIGGLSLMSSIARQSPQLPPLLQSQLMSCFLTALRHADLMPKLIEPPEIYTDDSGSYAAEVSVYQTLVLAMGNMRESAPSVQYCKEALHWSALADSCAALCAYSESLPATLVIVAEAASYRVAASNKTSAGGEREEEDRVDDDDDEDKVGDNDNDNAQDCGMSRACTLLHDFVLRGDTIVHSMLSTLRSYLSLACNRVGALPRIDLSLYELLQRSRVISCLAALTALSQCANELSSLCEWSTPLRDCMEADAELCRQAVISFVVSLLKLDGGLGLLSLASNSSAVHLMWQYMSKEESVMYSQSIGEVQLISEESGGSNGFLSVHPSSVGWIVWLVAYTTSLVEQVVSAAASIDSLTASGEIGGNPAKQRLKGDAEKNLLDAQAVLFEGVEALNACTYSSVGSSVVIRVVSHFCFKEILAVAEINSSPMSGSSTSVLSSAARIVFLCGLSGEPCSVAVLSEKSTKDKMKELASSITNSPSMSLATLEQSVAAAAALAKQSAKSIDPRHKNAKVDVPRVHTDDTRALAHRMLLVLQTLNIAPQIDAEDQMKVADSSVDKSIELINPSAVIAKCKLIVKDFSLSGSDLELKKKDRSSLQKKFSQLLPALSTAATTLLASVNSSSAATVTPPQSTAGDGDLLHDLLNALETLAYHLSVSDVASLRYGGTHSSSLDALIIADMVRAAPTHSLLLKNSAPPVAPVDVPVSEVESSAITLQLASAIAEAEASLDALKACMRLLLEILRITQPAQRSVHGTINSSSSSQNALVARVLQVAMETRAAALVLVGEDKAGGLGSAVREVCALSVGIVGLYCPHINFSGMDGSVKEEGMDVKPLNSNSGALKLVACIAKRAIDRPAIAASNISMLIELLPIASIHCNLDSNTTSAYDVTNATIIDSEAADRVEPCWSILRAKQTSMSVALFNSWEEFIWLKDDTALTVVSVEEAEKQKEALKEEELFKGSGSMVLPDDPLHTDLHHTGGSQESKISLLTLILFAINSTSWEIHRLAAMLCTKSMCLGAESATKISKAIVHTIQRRVALHLDFSTMEGEGEMMFAPELSLCRLFIIVEALCSTTALCLAFLQEGLLLPVLQSLRGSSDRNVCVLAMQLVATIYRTIVAMSSSHERIEIKSKNDTKIKSLKSDASIRSHLLWVTYALSDALVQSLPLALVSFQDSPNGVLLWQQVVLTMSLLPSSDVKRIIETVTTSVTLEGLAVKLWLAFEDSYQQLFEVTELIKLCLSNPEEASLQDLAGEDSGQGALQCAHMLFTGAACALRAVIDFALMAFLEGTIALPTLARTCRCSLSDPKRVVLRYQRAYTMWAVQSRQGSSTTNKSSGADSSRGWKRSGVYAPFVSSSMTDPQCASAFDARHELISAALRRSVESTGKIARLVAGREVRPKGGVGIIKKTDGDGQVSTSSPGISADFDFYRPFSEIIPSGCDAVSVWFADVPPAVRLPRLCELRSGSSSDTLHTILRRGMLYGDDTECSLYDSCVSVQLEAVRSTMSGRMPKRKRISTKAPPIASAQQLTDVNLKRPQMPTFTYGPPSSRPTVTPAIRAPTQPPQFSGFSVPPPPPPSFPPHPLQQQQFNGRGPPAPEFHAPNRRHAHDVVR